MNGRETVRITRLDVKFADILEAETDQYAQLGLIDKTTNTYMARKQAGESPLLLVDELRTQALTNLLQLVELAEHSPRMAAIARVVTDTIASKKATPSVIRDLHRLYSNAVSVPQFTTQLNPETPPQQLMALGQSVIDAAHPKVTAGTLSYEGYQQLAASIDLILKKFIEGSLDYNQAVSALESSAPNTENPKAFTFPVRGADGMVPLGKGSHDIYLKADENFKGKKIILDVNGAFVTGTVTLSTNNVWLVYVDHKPRYAQLRDLINTIKRENTGDQFVPLSEMSWLPKNS